MKETFETFFLEQTIWVYKLYKNNKTKTKQQNKNKTTKQKQNNKSSIKFPSQTSTLNKFLLFSDTELRGCKISVSKTFFRLIDDVLQSGDDLRRNFRPTNFNEIIFSIITFSFVEINNSSFR